MLAPTGNMAHVYKRVARNERRGIKRRAEKAINQVVASTPKTDAEITKPAAIDDAPSGDWFMVQTFPGDDLRAMRWLSRRYFGVFRPMQQKTRDHLRYNTMEPVFPGHLFVYVWEIDKMVGRVLACPGVVGILCMGGRPMRINQPDKRTGKPFIDRLRELSFVFETPNARIVHKPKRATRPDKRQRRALDRLQFAVKTSKSAQKRLQMGCEIRGIRWDESTWSQISRLEPHERIALLTWTLNAPSLMVGQAA